MELKFSPVVHLDKRQSFVKFQVDHLPGLHFTRRFPNGLANAYNLRSTSSIGLKLGPIVPNKKSNRLPLFCIGHITSVYFTDRNICILQTSL